MNKIIKKTKDGFTLIELLVVISIVSLLSTVVLGSLKSARNKGKNAAYVSEMVQLRNAINLYKNDDRTIFSPENIGWSGDYSGRDNLDVKLQPVVDAGYIETIPHHPDWPENSIYVPGQPRTYTFLTGDYDGWSFDDRACGYLASSEWTGGEFTVDELPDHSTILVVATNDPDVVIPGIEPGMSYCSDWGTGGNPDYCYSYGGPNSTYKRYCLPM